MPVRRLTASLAAALVIGGLAGSAVRVLAHERSELEHESEPRTLEALASAPGSTRVSARVSTVELRAGEHALFELCARDRLESTRWLQAFELAVFRLADMHLMLRVPLDAAHLETARRNDVGACLRLGGGLIERAGRYSIDAVWPARPPAPELRSVELQARVLAIRPLSALDRAFVLAAGLGAVLLILALLARPATPDDDAPTAPSHARPLLLAAAAIAALVLATRVPTAGASMTLVKGIGLVLLQGGAALVLGRSAWPAAARAALAFARPKRILFWLGAALATAALLVITAHVALRLVPATSEAPIQSFVSWPSGLLCFAALGVVLPLGEELFFRGYLYAAALSLGRAAAFGITFALFVALHAEQSWGNWGGLVSVAAAGLALTALRAQSGSVLIPALAHVLYNFALSMASF
jgi:membrane protease YdiL (CAAX protease family)